MDTYGPAVAVLIAVVSIPVFIVLGMHLVERSDRRRARTSAVQPEVVSVSASIPLRYQISRMTTSKRKKLQRMRRAIWKRKRR